MNIHLKILRLDDSRGRAWREQVRRSDDCTQNASYSGEEAEDILDAIEAVVHGGQLDMKHQQRVQSAPRAVCRVGGMKIGLT